ncbi:beta-lactamase family protein [bacterium]|nr:beta-lactamase family protein [bacterium]
MSPHSEMRSTVAHRYIAFLILFFIALVFTGCQDPASRVQATLKQAADKGTWQGTAFVRVGTDTLAYTSSTRFGTNPDRTPGTSTPVALASVSKLFTMTMVLQLDQAGLLDLDARLLDVRPSLASTGLDSITIRHLVTHRAGLPREINGSSEESAAEWNAEGYVGPWLDGLSITPETVPGGDSKYSNLGYWLLGGAMEAATGQTITELLDSLIAQPYGLETLGYARHKPFPGFEMDGSFPTIKIDLRTRYTSGGYVASLDDVCRFIDLLMAGDILDEEHLDLLFNDFGYEEGGEDQLSVAAHLPGYSNRILIDRPSELIVALFINKNVEPMDDILTLASTLAMQAAEVDFSGSKKKDVYYHIDRWDEAEHPLEEAILEMAHAIGSESADSIEAVMFRHYDLEEFGPEERANDLDLLPKLPAAMGGWAPLAWKVEETAGINWIYLLMRSSLEVSDDDADVQFILGMAAQPEAPDKVFHVFYHFNGFKVK